MKKTWIIAKRELNSYFDSLIAYVIIVVFLVLTGFFTWAYGNTVFLINQASLGVFFDIAFWTLFFFIPAVTMRSLAEENRSGTIELLSTKAVSDLEIVAGKFLGSFILVAIALLCTLPYYITVSQLGSVDHGAIIGGYLGILFASAGYVSIGIFASSTTNNQIIGFLLALFISIFFHLLFSILASGSTGMLGSLFNYLSIQVHFDAMARGVIDSRDVVYFLTLVAGGLVMSTIMLSRRNLQD